MLDPQTYNTVKVVVVVEGLVDKERTQPLDCGREVMERWVKDVTEVVLPSTQVVEEAVPGEKVNLVVP
jgi:hypothetical protein